MFEPVSKLAYDILDPAQQAIVVVCLVGERAKGALDRWRDRACAIIGDTEGNLHGVVRDLLANPQVRAIVFDGDCCGRDAYTRFWLGETPPGWRIDDEHLSLVRQFVDLYDDDFRFSGPRPPFWPSRILYLDDKETA